MSVLVIVPSRGRPDNAKALLDVWHDTQTKAGLLLGLDLDDPTRLQYPFTGVLAVGEREGMAGTLNRLAVLKAATTEHSVIGFMGDDHRPRTVGWDRRVLDAVAEMGGTGIVYGNDLVHGPGLPTAVFMSADIVRTLGYMAPPCLRHMYLDNYWKQLGEQAGCLRYLPDVVIEHMHPLVGKAEDDEGYREVAALMGPDGEAYEAFVADGGLAIDSSKVRALRIDGHRIGPGQMTRPPTDAELRS